MNKKDIQLLYEYNRWANAEILNATSVLSTEQFTKDLSSSHRSVRDTLTHILWAEWLWVRRWQGLSPTIVLNPADYPEVNALREKWKEVGKDQASFIDQVTDESLAEVIAYVNMAGEEWKYPLEQMLLHLANHSSYHRGQVTTMLRQLGAKAVPLDFLVFIDMNSGDGWRS